MILANGKDSRIKLSEAEKAALIAKCRGHSLKDKVPVIAAQMHPTENGDLTSEMISWRSAQQIVWLYPYDDPVTGKHFDFVWVADPHNRVRYVDCPFFSGKRLWTGYNDFATRFPEEAKEWDYEKNGDLTPDRVAACSNKKRAWKCKRGHEWIATPSDRARGRGCPFCKQSKGESEIQAVLKSYSVDFKREYKFQDCRYKSALPFDFAVFKNDNPVLLIEYDGEQHFEYRSFGRKKRETDSLEFIQLRDAIKTEYCKKRGIPLLRIPYTEKANIKAIVPESLAKYGLIDRPA